MNGNGYLTLSPLERALGEKTSLLHIVLEDLYTQLQGWRKLSDDDKPGFAFRIRREDAKAAQQEYYRAMCEGELELDAAVNDLFVPKMISYDQAKVYYTHARCPVYSKLVGQRFEIGKDIPYPDFADVLSSSDARLSEQYRPQCPLCSGHEFPVQHKTILSFMRYLPRDFIKYFDVIDEQERNIMVTEQAIGKLRSINVFGGPAVESLERLAHGYRELKEKGEEFMSSRLKLHPSDLLYASSRRKGSSRVAEKIMYLLIERINREERIEEAPLFPDDQPQQILDISGVRVVAKTREAALQAIKETRDTILDRYGPDALRPAREAIEQRMRDPRGRDIAVVHDDILYMDSEGHTSCKLWALWGDSDKRLCIAFQGMSLEDEEKDKRDHPFYEERQSKLLDEARRHGLPVDALRAEVIRFFDHSEDETE